MIEKEKKNSEKGRLRALNHSPLIFRGIFPFRGLILFLRVSRNKRKVLRNPF